MTIVILLINILLCVMVLVTLVPVSIFFVQMLLALPTYRARVPSGTPRAAAAILIPAHNEALLIAGTLRTIVPQLLPGDRCLVVADNCTDETARIAAAAGAEVIERSDPQRRGKGYALDFGVRHLEKNPPAAVLIIDADCEVGANAIDILARKCIETRRPVQGLYLMHAPEGADFRTRVAEFAWLVKNHIRPLGYHRLGLPCQLFGAGMAFPWLAISNAPLAGGHLQEETKLGIDLTRARTPQIFCPEALVTSYFPSNNEGIRGQRTQWEHGHMGIIVNSAPRLFAEAVTQGNLKLFALVLDMCIPPLAFLLLLVSTLFAMSGAFWWITGAAAPFWLAASALAMLVSGVLLSWVRYGRHVISAGSLMRVPLYVLWKVPLYLKFLVRRHTAWVRTKRDGE